VKSLCNFLYYLCILIFMFPSLDWCCMLECWPCIIQRIFQIFFINICYFVDSEIFLTILQTSFTAAGCYLCPAPRSRGTKILVCCSVDCPLNSKMELIYPFLNGEQKHYFRNELEQIIADGKSYSNHFVPDASDVHFLDASESVISEAKTLNIISESTYRDILLLKREEIKHFKHKAEDKVDYKSKNKVESIIASPSELLQPGKACYFMNRFWITWKLSNHVSVGEGTENCVADLGGESQECHSCSCRIGHDKVAEVRRMSESDWLYLAKLSKCPSLDNLQQQKVLSSSTMEQISEKRSLHLENLELSAQKALEVLKSIPVAARRSLPVLVNHQGLLLSIPVTWPLFWFSLILHVDAFHEQLCDWFTCSILFL